MAGSVPSVKSVYTDREGYSGSIISISLRNVRVVNRAP